MRALATLSMLWVALACRPDAGPTLAVVEGRPVTPEQYRKEYVDYLASTGLPDSPTRRRSFLERMVSVRLVVVEAREDGLAESPEFAHFAETARRRLLVDAYLADAFFDTLAVSQAELESMFARVNTRVTARHLFAGSRAEADRLAGRLADGEPFEDLAGEVFADTALAGSGGLIGTFGFDEMDPAFEDVAFSQPVGLPSEPVRTAQGWSIVRVDDRFTSPVMTVQDFAARLPQLEAYVRERRRAEIRRKLAEDLEVELDVQLDSETAARLLRQITGSEAGLADDEPLATYRVGGDRHPFSIAQFREEGQYSSDRQRASVRDERTLLAFATGLLVRRHMTERALAARLDRTERYREALDAALDERLYELAYGRLSSRVPIEEDSMRAYFDRHADEFMLPEQVQVHEIVAASRYTADSLRVALGQSSFENLARRHSTRSATAAVGGEIGWLSRSDLGPFGDDVFAAAEGSIVGPLEIRGAYLLLLVGPRRPARAASLDDVRTDIENALRQERQRDFLRDHTRSLRKRFQVTYGDLKPEDLPLASLPIR